jgi:hypothetical protein
MKKIFFFLALVIIMISCDNETPNYIKLAHKIINQEAKKLEKEKGLVLIGTGGRMMDDIEEMYMGFQYFKEVDLDTARKLLVYCIEKYLSAINSDEKVRPYLHNYPSTVKNVEIGIWFYKPDRTNLSWGKIYYVSAINGVLSYYIKPSKNQSREAICEETYEEALKIVKSNDKQSS